MSLKTVLESAFKYDDPIVELRKGDILAGFFAITGNTSTIAKHIEESYQGQKAPGRIDHGLMVRLLMAENREDGWLSLLTKELRALLQEYTNSVSV